MGQRGEEAGRWRRCNRERWLAVPFFQFIDRVMNFPVVRAAFVLAMYNCVEDRGDSCGVPVPQRQVPAVLDPSWKCLRFSSSSTCQTFLLCYRDALTVQTVQKTAEIPLVGEEVDMPVVVQRPVPGNGQCTQLWSSTVAVLWRWERRQDRRRQAALSLHAPSCCVRAPPLAACIWSLTS